MCVLTQPVVLIFVFNDQLEILILVDNHYLSTQENSWVENLVIEKRVPVIFTLDVKKF